MIEYKTLIFADGVMIAHVVGIVDVPLKDLFERRDDDVESYHPDLVAAANETLRALVRKYNGVNDETEESADDKPQAGTGEIADANAVEETGGNADEEKREG
jgi:hypothetical protein